MNDRAKLWNAVEAAEKRKDAQTARDYLLSIPHQLSPEQRRALVKWFVAEQFVTKGYAADIAFHGPDAREGLNHHAHVMVTMRKVEGDGFCRMKERPPAGTHPMKAWKDDLLKLREAWALSANRFLEAAGLDIRITHESLQTRGIDREPDPKLGPVAGQIEAQGRESHAGNDRREVAARNAEREQLKLEHAEAVADEARIIDLMRRRSEHARAGTAPGEGVNPMTEQAPRPEPFDLDRAMRKQQDEQLARQENGYRQLQEEADKTRLRRELEARAERDAEEARQAQARTRANDQGLNNAEARYQIALGDNYDIRDPYGSLARAAGAEHAAFIRQQQTLRQEAFAEQDALKKQIIDNRRMVESADYMTITSDRLIGISIAVAGRRDAPEAIRDAEKAAFWRQQAAIERDERNKLLEQLRDREAAAQRAKEAQPTPQPVTQQQAREAPPPASEAPKPEAAKPEAPRPEAQKPEASKPTEQQPSAPVEPQRSPAQRAMDAYLGTSPAQAAQPSQPATTAQPAMAQTSQPAQEQNRPQPPQQQPTTPGQQPAPRDTARPSPSPAPPQPPQPPQQMPPASSQDNTRAAMDAYLHGPAQRDAAPREQTDAGQQRAGRQAGREVSDAERQSISEKHDRENQALDRGAPRGRGGGRER